MGCKPCCSSTFVLTNVTPHIAMVVMASRWYPICLIICKSSNLQEPSYKKSPHSSSLKFPTEMGHLLGIEFEHLLSVFGSPILVAQSQTGSTSQSVSIGEERISIDGF